jgi:hypothetical protein
MRVQRLLKSGVVSFAIVGSMVLLAVLKIGTPIPFLILLPGIIAGAPIPDSHFDPEGQAIGVPGPGPWSITVFWLVNITLYAVILYFSAFRGEKTAR